MVLATHNPNEEPLRNNVIHEPVCLEDIDREGVYRWVEDPEDIYLVVLEASDHLVRFIWCRSCQYIEAAELANWEGQLFTPIDSADITFDIHDPTL